MDCLTPSFVAVSVLCGGLEIAWSVSVHSLGSGKTSSFLAPYSIVSADGKIVMFASFMQE